MPRNARKRHQRVPVRQAEERTIDLGALEAQRQIVAAAFDAGDLELHAGLASNRAGSILPSTKNTLSIARKGRMPAPTKTCDQP